MNKQEYIPALRFPEFTENWVVKKLGEMIEFKAGYAFKSEQMLSVKDNYQILKMSNVYKNELRLDRNPSYWGSVNSKEKEFLLQIGDTILTLTGTVGKQDYGYSVQIKESNKYLLNQRLVLLRELQCISNNDFISQLISNEKFLFYFFAESKGGTGNQSNVSIEDVKSIHLSFPTLPEQQKIATFLSSVDEKLQGLKKKKSLLEAYKKGMMQRLFSQTLRFKDENGVDFPEWELKRIEEVAPLQRGFDLPVDKINVGKFPVVFSNGISKHHNNFKVKAPGVVTGRSGTIGNVTYVEKDYWPHNTTLWVTDFKSNSPKFIYYFYSKYNLERFGTGSGVPTLNRNDVHIQEEYFPTLPEQTKIANFLSAIDEKIAKVSQEIEQVTVWKKGLLQQLFV